MKWKSYPKYKESGVEWFGEVPEHWEVLKGSRIGRLFGSEQIPEDAVCAEGSIPFLKVGSISTDGFKVESWDWYVKDDWEIKVNIPSDFVVFPKRGAAIFTNKVNIVDRPALIDPNLMGWVISQRATTRFVAYLLKARTLDELADVSTVPQINNKHIYPEQFPVPPVPEQIEIAAHLDRETAKIDTLISKQERLIELLQEKRQALISHAVTKGLNPDTPMKPSGVEWLGEVPKHWAVIPLKRRWSISDCKHRTAEYVDDGIPIVSTTEVKPGYLNLIGARMTTEADYLDLSEGRKPKRGDIVYSRNASVGSAAFVDTDERFCLGQDVCLVTSATEDQLYLMFQLGSSFLMSQLGVQMVGSTFRRINVADIAAFTVCCPPLTEQHQIAEQLQRGTAQIDDLIDRTTAAIALMREHRTALISAAVTGKIDVREPQPSAHA